MLVCQIVLLQKVVLLLGAVRPPGLCSFIHFRYHYLLFTDSTVSFHTVRVFMLYAGSCCVYPRKIAHEVFSQLFTLILHVGVQGRVLRIALLSGIPVLVHRYCWPVMCCCCAVFCAHVCVLLLACHSPGISY